jgi:hypothetical protein
MSTRGASLEQNQNRFFFFVKDKLIVNHENTKYIKHENIFFFVFLPFRAFVVDF